MEQDRLVLFAALAIAFALGVFVFWGPSNLKRKRGKGHVGGLLNLGHSCFMNALLQAFGSCPHIVCWLAQHPQSDGVIGALRLTLQVINGEHPEIRDDPFAPSDILSSLKARWHIDPGEQDAHELFIVLVSALEDEIQKASLPRFCSLSDALDLPTAKREPRTASQDSGTSHNGHPVFIREVHSEATSVSRSPPREVRSSEELHSGGRGELHRRRRTPLVRSVKFATLPREMASPFQGLLTSSLQCTKCDYKNVVQLDKFDSLSLPLPSDMRCRHSLTELLDNFVATETVCVHCENCKLPQVDFLKTLNFAKLPGCLCIHIVRTTWLSDGRPSKRMDQVDYPEVLLMDKYTYTQREGDVCARRHLYQLKAVVVHKGDLNSGHFVTYRRSKHSWVLTSDAEVMECTYTEAMSASAYMLFYDKC